MYGYMYTCKRMSCTYSISCIYLYGAQRLRSGCKSWQRLQNGARWRWTIRLSLVHPLKFHHHLGPHVRHPCFTPSIIRHETEESVKTKGRKILFWRGKNRDFESKGIDLDPPGGSLWEWKGMGITDSRNHSRKFSRELWDLFLCFIIPILGNRCVQSRGFIMSEPRRRTHDPRSLTSQPHPVPP